VIIIIGRNIIRNDSTEKKRSILFIIWKLHTSYYWMIHQAWLRIMSLISVFKMKFSKIRTPFLPGWKTFFSHLRDEKKVFHPGKKTPQNRALRWVKKLFFDPCVGK
jgi:hypothetical protein